MSPSREREDKRWCGNTGFLLGPPPYSTNPNMRKEPFMHKAFNLRTRRRTNDAATFGAPQTRTRIVPTMVEELEFRRLLAFAYTDGIFYCSGTSSADSISVVNSSVFPGA